MFETKVEPVRNLLTIHFSRKVEPEEAKRCSAQVSSLMSELRPGFRLLTDLSGLESMDMDCVPHIRSVMELCNQRMIGAVVRIIPDPHKDIGLNILSLFHYGRGVQIVTCQTLEEARKILG